MILSVSLIMLLSMIPTSIFAVNETEYENKQQDLFTYTFTEPENAGENGTAIITGFVENYQELLGSSAEIIIPDVYVNSETGVKYNCELNATKSKFMQNNDFITKITFPSSYSSIVTMFLKNATALKTIVFKNSISFQIFGQSLYGCTSLEKMYVYADNLSGSPMASVFTNVPITAIAYVKNETVKEKLVNWPGQIIVDPDLNPDKSSVVKTALQNKITEAETFLSGIDKSKYNNVAELETAIAHAKTVNENASATQTDVDNEVIALASALNKVTKIKQASSFTITCESINYGTEGGFKPQVNITAGDGEITYKLFSDEACKNESGYNYNNSRISPNSYYIKGFMAETENYYASESNVLKVQVYSIGVSKKDLNDAITLAETFFEENESNKIDFNSAAWNDVYASNTGALARAKSIAQNNSGTIFQSEVDERTQNLITALNKLKESPADTTEIRAELDNVIKTAEAIENIYSNESWQAFQTALNAAKDAFAKENEFKSFYSNAKDTLFSAIENLTTEDAGEPFINIRKGGAESELINKKAEESMNGAVKVKLTLDCADDVSFNKYASIELKAMIAGTESYAKIVGTGTEEEAIKGEKGVVVELPLKNPIATGDDVKLTAYTWAWNGYVFVSNGNEHGKNRSYKERSS